jgi:hypothetical protein
MKSTETGYFAAASHAHHENPTMAEPATKKETK